VGKGGGQSLKILLLHESMIRISRRTGPGTHPFTQIQFAAVSTFSTGSFQTVAILLPTRPGIFFPLYTLEILYEIISRNIYAIFKAGYMTGANGTSFAMCFSATMSSRHAFEAPALHDTQKATPACPRLHVDILTGNKMSSSKGCP
jgi:hypothetical protein